MMLRTTFYRQNLRSLLLSRNKRETQYMYAEWSLNLWSNRFRQSRLFYWDILGHQIFLQRPPTP